MPASIGTLSVCTGGHSSGSAVNPQRIPLFTVRLIARARIPLEPPWQRPRLALQARRQG